LREGGREGYGNWRTWGNLGRGFKLRGGREEVWGKGVKRVFGRRSLRGGRGEATTVLFFLDKLKVWGCCKKKGEGGWREVKKHCEINILL